MSHTEDSDLLLYQMNSKSSLYIVSREERTVDGASMDEAVFNNAFSRSTSSKNDKPLIEFDLTIGTKSVSGSHREEYVPLLCLPDIL